MSLAILRPEVTSGSLRNPNWQFAFIYCHSKQSYNDKGKVPSPLLCLRQRVRENCEKLINTLSVFFHFVIGPWRNHWRVRNRILSHRATHSTQRREWVIDRIGYRSQNFIQLRGLMETLLANKKTPEEGRENDHSSQSSSHL